MQAINVKARGLEQPEPEEAHIRTLCVVDTSHGLRGFNVCLRNFSLALIPVLTVSLTLLCKIGIFALCHLTLKYKNNCLLYS